VLGKRGLSNHGPVLLKACVNGPRLPREHSALPVTAADLAHDVAATVTAGARAVHLHVKDHRGADTLGAQPLAEVLVAVRAAAPEIAVGVTTGAWALPDPEARVATIQGWHILPDFASVNWHEDGANEAAHALLDLGVGVEAGLWDEDAVGAWSRSPFRDRCLRVLLELPDGLDQADTLAMADQLLAAVQAAAGEGVEVLLHGEGSSAWPALQYAAELELATRIGLEDTLVLPDGSLAPDNAALVRRAVEIISAVEAARRLLPREL
jgi:uncharacterized protein (DUF849 family)